MPNQPVTVEYAVLYTERSAWDGREYTTTRWVGYDPDPQSAERTREYQAREGLPVDAVAVMRTVVVMPWWPVESADARPPEATT